jgi:hypothetical protein
MNIRDIFTLLQPNALYKVLVFAIFLVSLQVLVFSTYFVQLQQTEVWLFFQKHERRPIIGRIIESSQKGSVTNEPTVQVEKGYKMKHDMEQGKMSVCDVGIAIFHAPQHTIRQEHLRQSWTRSLCGPDDTVYKMAHHDRNANFRLWGSSNQSHTLEYDTQCSEEYENLCCKTLAFIQHARELMPGKKWYFKCDDDTYLHAEHLAAFLQTLDENEPILVGGETHVVLNQHGEKVKWGQKPLWGPQNGVSLSNNILYPRGGAGYAISRGLMKLLEEQPQTYKAICQQLVAEDMAIGIAAKEVGATIIPHVGFNFKAPLESLTSDRSYLNTAPVAWHMMQLYGQSHDTSSMPVLEHFQHMSSFKHIDHSFTGYTSDAIAVSIQEVVRDNKIETAKKKKKRKKKMVKVSMRNHH